jgi:hypothetical protein
VFFVSLQLPPSIDRASVAAGFTINGCPALPSFISQYSPAVFDCLPRVVFPFGYGWKRLQGAWIHGTKFSLTKISLFERLKFQALLTKEGLKLVLGLKRFGKEYPTKLCFSSLSSSNLIEICSMPHLLAVEGEKGERKRDN